jgi:hypothetical protein
MKKFLFVVAASFFCSSVYAQAKTLSVQSDEPGPRELKCTEEAISFRVSLQPGWQLSSFRLGPTDFTTASPGFITSKNYYGEDVMIEPIQLVKYENGFNRQGNYPDQNFLFPGKIINPFMQTRRLATDQFLYNYSIFLQRPRLNLLAAPALFQVSCGY